MKESEIIAKVQKEWDSLDEEAKLNLQKFYQQKNYLVPESAEPSPPKRDGKRKESVERVSRDDKGSKEKPKPQRLKVLEDVPEPMVDESDASSIKERRKSPI